MKDSESNSNESVEQSDTQPPTATVESTIESTDSPDTTHTTPELEVCLRCGVVGLPERIAVHDCRSDRSTNNTDTTPSEHALSVDIQFDDTLLNTLTLLTVSHEATPHLQLNLSVSIGGAQ